MNKIIGLCTMFLLSSCEPVRENPSFMNSALMARNLIQICVDSTLRLDSGLNSVNYLVDFKLVKNLNREGVKQFMLTRSEASETNLDSLLIIARRFSKYSFGLPEAVIRFEKITVRTDGMLLVEISKIRAADGFIDAELLLKPNGLSFKCIRSGITRIG
ncbi:hypothetical protein ACFP2F_13200 [Hymenobacter artigasi]